VLGGTGTAGRAITEELARRGHDVRVLSRHPPASLPPGAAHTTVDVADGAGLGHGLAGLDVVVDALNGPPRAPERVLVDGARSVVAAATRAGVGHLVCLSIVGCDRVALRYYRAKTEQERIVAQAGLPFTIVRATQFHDLLAAVFAATARAGVLLAPGIPLQPVAVADAAAAVADAAEASPRGGVTAFAGPQVTLLHELAGAWRAATGSRAVRLRLPIAGAALRALAAGALCDEDAPRGTVTFARWLADEA
jgi:uncharacterized protein YbjT (DUF2867 family)